MTRELNMLFPDPTHVIVSFDGETTGTLPFTNPVVTKDRDDIRWYLEIYGAHSLGDPDDMEAARIVALLPDWGRALFNAVFSGRPAQHLFSRFQDSEDEARLLTVSAEHPDILSLPWELLHDAAPNGVHLFLENPRISIRRRVSGATNGRVAFRPKAKDGLHLLFVVSRPCGIGFLDPRADPEAVLDALEKYASGRVSWEFLRRATIDALVERLEDRSLPTVDILHFDGHGIFDRRGGLVKRTAGNRKGDLLPFDSAPARERGTQPGPRSPANTGYLLFEDGDGGWDLVSADRLGQNLHRHRVALVVLSACQTAALGENDEPMGCVAARLTAAGIPGVLAMTHSVLVATTRLLFGEFYKGLARGHGVGEALDNARRYLRNHPERYEVQRGPDRRWLALHDWFVPALYQSGDDSPLLTAAAGHFEPQAVRARTNLPLRPEAGFYGRRRESWGIERWFGAATKRITITGFGGQGKTALAQEAGRWLTRTGLFQAAVFVDYASFQGQDAAGLAVSTLGTVLDRSLPDAEAAAAALRETPTLVILDNLESLDPEPLRELLNAAVGWSEAGGSRVLCTTRGPDFGHPRYRAEGTQRIVLAGLGGRHAPDDALEWFARLQSFPPAPAIGPPTREELIDVFEQVQFHPLSIRVLAQQLKTRRPDELGRRLGELLAAVDTGASSATTHNEDARGGLLASLQLSLDQLDEATRQALPRLGVFQGGAFESRLVAIARLGDPLEGRRRPMEALLLTLEGGHPQDSAGLPEEFIEDALSGDPRKAAADLREALAQPAGDVHLWPALRRQLEAAALIEVETLPDLRYPFIRFHPTLAPWLWTQLGADERARLSAAHRQRYHGLAIYLHHMDTRAPHQARAIARRELPNLLHALHAALDARDPHAVDFAVALSVFLDAFGLRRDAEAVTARARPTIDGGGSRAWLLAESTRGTHLLTAGRGAEAAGIFGKVLTSLGSKPSYDRANTLAQLARCHMAGGRPDLAVRCNREATSCLQLLDQRKAVEQLRGLLLSDLGNFLTAQGLYGEARKAYEDALKVSEEAGDIHGQAVIVTQLGTLSMLEGDLAQAAVRYRTVLALFRELGEPAAEATALHQLGMVFEKARQWDEAERHYREAARIREREGVISGPDGAAATWNQLAIVSEGAGRLEVAEAWYRRAIENARATGDKASLAARLNNLADLLRVLPGRLSEARALAEEALALKRKLELGSSPIWTTYSVLAGIARREAENAPASEAQARLRAEAREHRRLAREAKRRFPGTRHELRRHAGIIVGTVTAAQQPELRPQLEEILAKVGPGGGTELVAVIRRVLAGERDTDALCDALNLEDAMVVEAILQGIADPKSLRDLLPEEGTERQ